MMKPGILYPASAEQLKEAEANPAVTALALELQEIQERHKMEVGVALGMSVSGKGPPIYVAKCANGHHESYESHEHALFLLVDSHRTRVEDLEETHLQIQKALGGINIKLARKIAADAACEARAAYPDVHGEKLDYLTGTCLAEKLKTFQAELAKPQVPIAEALAAASATAAVVKP